MENSPYYLSKQAFYCLADNHYVFLDLRNDEYLCLGRTHTDSARGLLSGHQLVDGYPPHTQGQDTDDSGYNIVVQALLKKGLLVDNYAHGKLTRPTYINTPAASFIERSGMPRRIGPMHAWNFFTATAAASKNLRWQTIERTVRAVEDRKSSNPTACSVVDNATIIELFDIFKTLRPYYPRPYLCLFDSLALVHFLARYRVFPQWVFGVRLKPFNAHCWVQVEDWVVNDVIDNVRDYTPIMSI